MGFNTTILIRNDELHEIEQNPTEFVQKLWTAIQENKLNEEFFKGARLLSSSHADYSVLLAVGGNNGKRLTSITGGHSSEETFKESIMLVRPANISKSFWNKLTEVGKEAMLRIERRRQEQAYASADVSKTRIYYNDYVAHYDDPALALKVYYSMPKNIRCAFRNAGDVKPVYAHDLVSF